MKPNQQEVYDRFYQKIVKNGYFGNQIGMVGIGTYEADLEDGEDVSEFSIPTLDATYGEGGQAAPLIEQYFIDCFEEGQSHTLKELIKNYPSLTEIIEYAEWQRERFETLLKECSDINEVQKIYKVFREVEKHDTFQPGRDEMYEEYRAARNGGGEKRK